VRCRPAAEPDATTFVLVKPDAIARGMTSEIAAAWRSHGFAVDDAGQRTLSRADVFRMSHLERRLTAPIKHEFTAQYLSAAAVTILAVAGPDAVTASGTIKNVFRQAHDADELHSLIHCPADPAELAHQRWLLGDGPGPRTDDRELTDAETLDGCGLTRDGLTRTVAAVRPTLDPSVRHSWPVPTLAEAGTVRWWGVVVQDDTINSVDMIARAIRTELPHLSPAEVVRAALRVKARTGDPVCTARPAEAGLLWDAIGRHGLNSVLVPVPVPGRTLTPGIGAVGPAAPR
jgi:nucleoside diphosphate kinase